MATKEITRQTVTIDATGKSLGRLATEIAIILRGKNKPSWQPHIDAGDFVEISNVDKFVVTGKKMTDKIYYHHTGFPGGIRDITMQEKIEKKGYEKVLFDTVRGMLPSTRLRPNMMKRLIFASQEQK